MLIVGFGRTIETDGNRERVLAKKFNHLRARAGQNIPGLLRKGESLPPRKPAADLPARDEVAEVARLRRLPPQSGERELLKSRVPPSQTLLMSYRLLHDSSRPASQ